MADDLHFPKNTEIFVIEDFQRQPLLPSCKFQAPMNDTIVQQLLTTSATWTHIDCQHESEHCGGKDVTGEGIDTRQITGSDSERLNGKAITSKSLVSGKKCANPSATMAHKAKTGCGRGDSGLPSPPILPVSISDMRTTT